MDTRLVGPPQMREKELRYRKTGEFRRHAALMAAANGNMAPAQVYQQQVEKAVDRTAKSEERKAKSVEQGAEVMDEKRLDEMEAKLDRLILLMEMQINGEKLHSVAGYSWGRTSEGDPFIVLYPANGRLKHKVCRVYAEDFDKLPAFVDTAAIPESAQEGNPDRDQAMRQKIYRPTPPFTIATRDGRETQMGAEVRFSRTVEAPEAAPPKAAGRPAPPAAPAGKPDIFDYKYGDGAAATEAARPHFDAFRRANGEQSPASREALGEWCKAQGRI